MKKTLLLAAAALIAASASAKFEDYYSITYNGQPVENGSTIVCSNGEKQNNDTYKYEAVMPLTLTSEDQDPHPFLSAGCYLDTPATVEECAGQMSFCSSLNCYTPNNDPGNLGYMSAMYYPDWIEPGQEFALTPHIAEVPDAPFSNTYKFVLNCYEEIVLDTAGNVDYDPLPDSQFTFYVKFTNETGAVDAIDSDSNVPAVYYNLQGVQVDEPENGLYIVKQGDKVYKTVIRK